MYPGFQPQQRDALRTGVRRQMADQQLPKPQTTKLRAHIHAFELAVLCAKKFDAATGRRSALRAEQKKGDGLGQ
jgi:hypothetical protein